MADWTSSMQQTFEFYIVDPGTWKDVRLINTVKKCTIRFDLNAETLGSATIDTTESTGEQYIRVYLVTIQNGVTERHPLGTWLVQTPSSSFDGRVKAITMDAYTPLLELKEKRPQIGYSIDRTDLSGRRPIMDIVHDLTTENLRAPVVKAKNSKTLTSNFVAGTDDTWLTFLKDLMSNAKYSFDLDELSRVLFKPEQSLDTLQPIWTFDDGNSSILYPEIDMSHDLYGIPNVVEVIYSNGSRLFYKKLRIDDLFPNPENIPTSVFNRGREIIHRVTDPGFAVTSQQDVDAYAEKLLKELSTIEYTITYTHGYCPVRIGDCVRLNYVRSGFTDIKAKVISQTINCEPGCPVTEKAVFTKKLWG